MCSVSKLVVAKGVICFSVCDYSLPYEGLVEFGKAVEEDYASPIPGILGVSFFENHAHQANAPGSGHGFGGPEFIEDAQEGRGQGACTSSEEFVW